MQNNTSLTDIRTFVTIAEQGSFTQAATKLKSSRAHVSRQLAQLEKQMGVQLLIRTTRAQRLTAIGTVFYEQCLASLQAIDQAINTAKDETDQLQGKIFINSVGGIIGEDIVTHILCEFSRLYPDIEIELDFSSTRVDLITESFDLVIRMGELEDSGLVARKLSDIKVQVLASPAYLTEQPNITHPKDLEQHNCLTGSIKHWRFCQTSPTNSREIMSEIEVAAQGHFSCKSGRALINAAKSGVGVVRLPELYCEDEINNGTLLPAFRPAANQPQWHSPNVPLFLLYHRNRYQPARLRLLIEFFCEQFKTK